MGRDSTGSDRAACSEGCIHLLDTGDERAVDQEARIDFDEGVGAPWSDLSFFPELGGVE